MPRGVFQRKPAHERFNSRVQYTETCWLWTGALTSEGYGRLLVDGHRVPAHRYAYELVIGRIPNGLQLDHLCRVRHCVNPSHLEPVSQAVNVRRGVSPSAIHAAQAACIHGHSYDEANTYRTPSGRRDCRVCRSARNKERRLRLATP